MTTRDEIEARLKAATPGPWTTEKPSKDADGWARGVAVAATYGRQMIYANPPGGSSPAADQQLIAHAPTDLRHLLDALAAAEAEIARLREVLSSIAAYRIYPDRTESRIAPAYTAVRAQEVARAALATEDGR